MGVNNSWREAEKEGRENEDIWTEFREENGSELAWWK